MTNPYPVEFRERALRMLTEARPDHPSDFAAASHVAGRLGVNPETLRLWKKRADVNTGVAPGTTSGVQAEIKRLKKQIAELEKANEILRSASVCLPPSSAAPHRDDPLPRCDEGLFRGRARLPHHAGS